jgi:hypothetical protein
MIYTLKNSDCLNLKKVGRYASERCAQPSEGKVVGVTYRRGLLHNPLSSSQILQVRIRTSKYVMLFTTRDESVCQVLKESNHIYRLSNLSCSFIASFGKFHRLYNFIKTLVCC